MADARSGMKADLQVAVKRKGEKDFKVVETKRLPDWMAQKMAKLQKFAKGDSA